MDDGKPLVMSVFDRNDLLFLSFEKTGEGLWAEGAGSVCARGDRLEARFAPEKVSIGPAAHWAMRYSLASGTDFTLTRVGAGRLKITTLGWSALFAAAAAQ